MKKSTSLMLLALMFAGINAHGQIGITRNGKLQNIIGASPYYYYDKDLWAPQYLPRTKVVKIKVARSKYNSFSDQWTADWYFAYKIHYDSVGRITLIEEADNEYKPIVFERETGNNDAFVAFEDIEKKGKVRSTAYVYEDGKLASTVGLSMRYDQKGNLSKMISGNNYSWRITWTPQGYLSTVKKYRGGEDHISYDYGSNMKYEITQGGRNVLIMTLGSDNRINQRDLKVFDSHGVVIKFIQNYGDKRPTTDHFENKYDNNGNLIEHLPYKIVDGEKEYGGWRGFFYEYEYEFYE